MSSTKEMRLRIRSIRNISQVTRALETVAASKVRKAETAVKATHPYAEKAWKVLLHLARQPGHNSLHPLLTEQEVIKQVLVIMASGDRGLAGAYNMNIIRYTMQYFRDYSIPVRYIVVGRKGRDMLARRRKDIMAEFTNLPVPPAFSDVSAIGRIAVDEYLANRVDHVFLAYTEYINLGKQRPVVRKLLPLSVVIDGGNKESYNATHPTNSIFTYEPDEKGLLEQIISRFTAVQIYQAIIDAQASEFAARMVAMHNATENAYELTGLLQLEYNKVRQNTITKELLDIAAGADAISAVQV
jgi:F-type H+-transporting ATPase subunit gamma